MAQTRGTAGFTLIEVVIALAIVAITTTFAIASGKTSNTTSS